MKRLLLEKKKVIVLTIVAIIVTVFTGVTVYNYSKVKAEGKKIKEIQVLIENEKYEEVLKSINEVGNMQNPKNTELMGTYKKVLDNYIAINFESKKEELVNLLESFSSENKDVLATEVFLKMAENLTSKIETLHKEIEDEKLKLGEEKKKEEERLKAEKEEQEKAKKEQEKANGSTTSGANLSIANTNVAKNSSQIVTVVSKGGSYAELGMWEKDTNGNWKLLDAVPARLGQNGMKAASQVYEMDKCTPTGAYSLTEAFGINGNPGSGVPYRQLDGSEYWVDDVNSEYYNTMQFGEPNGRWTSAEKLVDFPGYYNYSLVIDYNRWPVIPGKSSAIFLHCDIGTYTYGCVAIAESKLVNLLNWLNPSKKPTMILDFSYDAIYSNY